MSSPFHSNGKTKTAIKKYAGTHTTELRVRKKKSAAKDWHISGRASSPGKRLREWTEWTNNTWQIYNILSALVITRWLWVIDVVWSGKKKTTKVERCSNSGQIGNMPIEAAAAYPVLVSLFNKGYVKVQPTQAVRQSGKLIYFFQEDKYENLDYSGKQNPTRYNCFGQIHMKVHHKLEKAKSFFRCAAARQMTNQSIWGRIKEQISKIWGNF